MSRYDKKSPARKRRHFSIFVQNYKHSEAPYLLWFINEDKWSDNKGKLLRVEISDTARWRRLYKKLITISWDGYHFVLNNRNKEIINFASEEEAVEYLEKKIETSNSNS